MNDVADSPVELARQETVGRILDTAERLFRHYGYAKTNVADIARDLGMSPANIYRFFASKVEIHQAICGRMLDAVYQMAYVNSKLPLSAEERLRRFIQDEHRLTVETMLDQQKVHEMVVVALERDWHVIDKHIDSIHELIAVVIAEGIAAGEFAEQDPATAARCFCAATATLCHPQMVAQCVMKDNRATPDQLIDFSIRALKK